MKRYILEIKPAVEPIERHKIEDSLKKLGYDVIGGGTRADMSSCDISLNRKIKKGESDVY